MYISPISAANNAVIQRKQTVQNNRKVQCNPSFKSAEYTRTFMKYFNGATASNEQIYRELMSKAQNVRGAVVDDIAKLFFKPEDYNRAIEGSRNSKPVYDSLNDASYRKPVGLVRSGSNHFVTIFNMGTQGGWLDLLFANLHQDLRICFHDINNFKKVICLGRDNDGKDFCVKTSEGIETIISAHVWSKL